METISMFAALARRIRPRFAGCSQAGTILKCLEVEDVPLQSCFGQSVEVHLFR